MSSDPAVKLCGVVINQVRTSEKDQYYRQYYLSLDLDNSGGWEEALTRIEGFARSVINR